MLPIYPHNKKVGEVFELNGKKYVAVERQFNEMSCAKCAFGERTMSRTKIKCSIVSKTAIKLGSCSGIFREDKKDIYFKLVEE